MLTPSGNGKGMGAEDFNRAAEKSYKAEVRRDNLARASLMEEIKWIPFNRMNRKRIY